MSGRTIKLIRKAAGGNPGKYRQLKAAYAHSPRNKRHEAKQRMADLAELERQQHVIKEATI